MIGRIGLSYLLIAIITASSVWAQSSAMATLGGTIVDESGAPIPGVSVMVTNTETGLVRRVTSRPEGSFTLSSLPPGHYMLQATRDGFRTFEAMEIVLLVGEQTIPPIKLKVGTVVEKVEVDAQPLLETQTSSTGTTINPQQIEQTPINGRNYLDLLQLVPGVALNQQNDPSKDAAVPILGERAGNTMFLIDGLPNRDEVNGGPASPFNQDSILEFQVITNGYKAEFGHGSGGVVNVVSKSGTNNWNGGASFFHRNYKLDSSDIPGQDDPPFLLRWDPSAQLGGPIVKDKVFFFASAERIRESRSLNFQFPPETPAVIQQLQEPFNLNSETYETLLRAKLDEQLGRHHLSEQFNLTNTHVTDYLPLSDAVELPSTRDNLAARHLMLGINDTVALGDLSNPFLLAAYAQYRGEPSANRASHPEAGLASVFDNLFSSLDTNQGPGDLGQVLYGPGHSPLVLDANYVSFGANLAKQINRHGLKFGWDFMRTHVDGTEATNYSDQLWSTVGDLAQYGPLNSGIQILTTTGCSTPQACLIRLRNNYNGLFVQDDWKVRQSLTLNLGMRWDYDSRFPNKTNFSPRLGFAWSMTPKTVLRGSFGLFYDHFRVGIARDIAGFGGADLTVQNSYSFPRLFYGNPSQVSHFDLESGLNVPCLANNLTDAQIAGSPCPYVSTGQPYYGIDHLNDVVAPGHAPIPAGAVVNVNDVQTLSGLTPQQFANEASLAVGENPGYWGYDAFGHLATTVPFQGIQDVPITVDPNFRTPYTRSYMLGIQRELTSTAAFEIDYYHKDIRNILGVRVTNLSFEARLPGFDETHVPGTGDNNIYSYGPWFQGTYDGVIVSFRKRVSRRFTLDANYTWTHQIDNVLNGSLVSDFETSGSGASNAGGFTPTDSFVGVPPVVTETDCSGPNGAPPCTILSNAKGSFISSNGNPVPQAGIFYNGANLDKGPSDFALTHTFLVHGVVQLPWKMYIASIFRAQSGFRYSQIFSNECPDVDGGGNCNGVNFFLGRNHFTAPPFVNLDLRLAKRFDFGEKWKLSAFIEFFNALNRGNPAAVQAVQGESVPFGAVIQRLPGEEGQVGVQIVF
jgi:Carboxypeptidase regulatory-like domain/TonB dependent receptor/TonB-dependent Receptor Plug Domain